MTVWLTSWHIKYEHFERLPALTGGFRPLTTCDSFPYDSQQTGGDARWAIMRSGRVEIGEPRKSDGLE